MVVEAPPSGLAIALAAHRARAAGIARSISSRWNLTAGRDAEQEQERIGDGECRLRHSDYAEPIGSWPTSGGS